MTGRHHERGSSIPETAIVLIATLTILFGIIDFGRCLYTYETIANMARAGARWAIVRGANCGLSGESGESACPAAATDIQTYVKGLAIGVIDPTQVTVNTTGTFVWPGGTGCTAPCKKPGYLAVVQVSYPFNFILPLLPSLTINMSSTSQMVIAQ